MFVYLTGETNMAAFLHVRDNEKSLTNILQALSLEAGSADPYTISDMLNKLLLIRVESLAQDNSDNLV